MRQKLSGFRTSNLFQLSCSHKEVVRYSLFAGDFTETAELDGGQKAYYYEQRLSSERVRYSDEDNVVLNLNKPGNCNSPFILIYYSQHQKRKEHRCQMVEA